MASIGGITIDGFETDKRYKSAIALHLTKESTVNKTERLDEWEFELRRGNGFVVARRRDPLDKQTVLREGQEKAERFLDILSFEESSTAEVDGSGSSHILLFERNEKPVLERVATADMPMSICFSVTQRDRDGQAIPPQAAPPAKWIPALRFYRLSQTSRNPHEAYRNLWLGLESLLSAAAPKGSKEKEGVWLRRSLAQITGSLDLSLVVPGGANVIDHIMDRHYTAMRCNLFHAKIGTTSTTPQMPTAGEAIDAYAELIRIWRTIAFLVGDLRSTGSGLITYAGYAMQMAAVFSQVRFHATDDNTLPTSADTEVSPNGRTIIDFDSSRHMGVVVPGRVGNLGVLDTSTRERLPTIHRIATSIGETLYSVDHMAEGLDVNGVENFEYRQNWRLLNTGMPRENFD